MKSRSSVLAPADPGGPGKRAVKWLWWWWCRDWMWDMFEVLAVHLHNASSRAELSLCRWNTLDTVFDMLGVSCQ